MINPRALHKGELILEGLVGHSIDDVIDQALDVAKALAGFVETVTLKANEVELHIMIAGCLARRSCIYRQWYKAMETENTTHIVTVPFDTTATVKWRGLQE